MARTAYEVTGTRGFQGGERAGPREGRGRAGGVRKRPAAHAPGLAPRPPLPALSSGRARALAPAGLTGERPLLPSGFCVQASPAGREGSRQESLPPPPPRSLPDGAPGQRTARTRARPPLTRPRTERPGRSLGVRNAPRRLGWACRAGLFQGRSQAAGRVGKCSRSPCQGCVRTLRGALKPAQFTTGTHRVPEAGTGDSSLFRRRKEEEKGDGAAAPQCACARFQFFFFFFKFLRFFLYD